MSTTPPPLPYATPVSKNTGVTWMRCGIAAVGIAMPYLARLPGVPFHGWDWLTSYFGDGLYAIWFFGLFNAINWGAILLGTLGLRSMQAMFVTAIIGFALPAYMHATLDLSADAQAAIGLIAIPIISLPLVAVAVAAGASVDWELRRTRPN